MAPADMVINTDTMFIQDMDYTVLVIGIKIAICTIHMQFINKDNLQLNQVTTPEQVLALRQQGLSHREISEKLGFSRLLYQHF